MGNRLSKIYTRTGDDGSTGLADGSRIAKDSPRICAMGDIDELNCTVGNILACDIDETIASRLLLIQHDLFNLGGELSLPDASLIEADHVTKLELWLDEYNQTLSPLEEFILPGGGQAAAACHLARAVCRRAERSLYHLSRIEPIEKPLLMYINRLSDLLFVICRVLASKNGEDEVYWQNPVK